MTAGIVEIHIPSVVIHGEEVLMPRIIVTAENGGEPVLFDERVEPVHLDDTHHSVQLLERIASALANAEKAETRSAAAPG